MLGAHINQKHLTPGSVTILSLKVLVNTSKYPWHPPPLPPKKKMVKLLYFKRNNSAVIHPAFVIVLITLHNFILADPALENKVKRKFLQKKGEGKNFSEGIYSCKNRRHFYHQWSMKNVFLSFFYSRNYSCTPEHLLLEEGHSRI